MKRPLAAMALMMFVSFSGHTFAFERGDLAYYCFTASSGFLWSTRKHSCRVRVLEKAGSRYRVQVDDGQYGCPFFASADTVHWMESYDLNGSKSACR